MNADERRSELDGVTNEEMKTANSDRADMPDWLKAVVRSKGDYRRACLGWVIGGIASVMLYYLLLFQPYLSHLPGFVKILIWTALVVGMSGLLIARYGWLPFILGPGYLVAIIILRMLGLQFRIAQIELAVVTYAFKSTDKVTRMWLFTGTALGVQIWLVWLALTKSQASGVSFLLGLIISLMLYQMLAFGRWLSNPFKCVIALYDRYDRLARGLTGLNTESWANSVITDDDKASNRKSVAESNKRVIEVLSRIGNRAFLSGVFACVFALLVLLTISSFAAVFRCIDLAHPDSFKGLEVGNTWGYLYFSVITIFTIGFGDILPVVPVAQLAVVAEAFCGMLLLILGVTAFSVISVDRFEEHIGYALRGANLLASALTPIEVDMTPLKEELARQKARRDSERVGSNGDKAGRKVDRR